VESFWIVVGYNGFIAAIMLKHVSSLSNRIKSISLRPREEISILKASNHMPCVTRADG
jgi:hypothetical protein